MPLHLELEEGSLLVALPPIVSSNGSLALFQPDLCLMLYSMQVNHELSHGWHDEARFLK